MAIVTPSSSVRTQSSGRTPSTSRLRSVLRDARVLARTELRTRARALRADLRKLLATGFMLLLFGVGLPLLLVRPALDYGSALASGTVPAGASGLVMSTLAIVGLYFGGAGGFNQNRIGNVGPLVRTSISPRAVALGRLVAEMIQAGAIIVPTALILLVAVGVGAGGPVAPVVLLAATIPVLLASLFVGRVLGDGLRYANRYLRVSLWTKALLFVIGTTAVYVGSQVLIRSRMGVSDGIGSISIPALLPGEPLQAYATVALDPLAVTARPLGGVVAVVVLGTIPLALAVALRLETGLLLAESSGDAGGATGSRSVPRLFRRPPSARVAWRYLLRTRRDPRMLAHLGPLLFAALAMLGSSITQPRGLLLLVPGAIVIGACVFAGAAFCLNPLGDDRRQLPLLLTSVDSTGVLLRGRALAGLIPGLAIAIGVGFPLGVYAYGLPMAVGQSLLAVVLALAGTGTCLGVGALIPKFERREYMSVERAHPSMIAVMAVFFGGMVVGAIGLLLVFWTITRAGLPLALVAWAVYLAVLGLCGGGGYRYAGRAFGDLTLEDA